MKQVLGTIHLQLEKRGNQKYKIVYQELDELNH